MNYGIISPIASGVYVLMTVRIPTVEHIAALMKATADVLSAIAWPLMAIGVIWIFRVELRKLVDRIRKVGILGADVDVTPVQQVIEQAAETARGGAAVPPGGLPPAAPAPGVAAEDPGNALPAARPMLPPAPPGGPITPPVLEAAQRNIRQMMEASGATAPADRAAYLLELVAGYQLVYLFEMIYRAIFGSQLRLVQLAAPGGPVAFAAAEQLYEQPTIGRKATGITFELWYQYPVGMGLLTVTENRAALQITEKGREFLRYLAVTGIPLVKPF